MALRDHWKLLTAIGVGGVFIIDEYVMSLGLSAINPLSWIRHAEAVSQHVARLTDPVKVGDAVRSDWAFDTFQVSDMCAIVTAVFNAADGFPSLLELTSADLRFPNLHGTKLTVPVSSVVQLGCA
jgi:hypothetical protein